MREYLTANAGRSLLLPALLGLGGCTVYVPMQGAAPEIRGKGEVEVAASYSLSNRLELAAAYAPAPHLLLRAATSLKGNGGHRLEGGDQFAQVNQYELAAGTYWPLGPHWLVGGLAGFGQTHAVARYTFDDTSFQYAGSADYHHFDAIYLKYTLEAYATWQPSPRTSLGLSYRLVQARLTDVADNGVPVTAAPILRAEPMLYLRVRLRRDADFAQLQLALGGSDAFGYGSHPATDRTDPAWQFKLSRNYVSVGVLLYPHVLWREKYP